MSGGMGRDAHDPSKGGANSGAGGRADAKGSGGMGGGGLMAGGLALRPQWAQNRSYPVTTMPGLPRPAPMAAAPAPMAGFPQVGLNQPGAVPNHSVAPGYASMFTPQMYARALGLA